MSSPTQNAQTRFHRSYLDFMEVLGNSGEADSGVPMHLREGLKQMAVGMGEMAVGLRATYLLIEQLQKDVQAMQRTLNIQQMQNGQRRP